MSSQKSGVAILGIFVADLAFRAGRMPGLGETIIGSSFKMGPGGKGSNQAVAAARAGASVTFISKLGRDEFGALALAAWKREGIVARVVESSDEATGAAFIYVNETSGENAIIVAPCAASSITAADVEAAADAIGEAAVFVTQLEQPIAAAQRGLQLAKNAGALTVFNPAPAAALDHGIYALCDFVTPNESEASLLSGMPVTDVSDARRAGEFFLKNGARAALITLGEAGVLFLDGGRSVLIPAFRAGAVVETAGAGDAFNGGFAAALAEGADPVEAARFGCAVAGISVTRGGTAPSMPKRHEVRELLARAGQDFLAL
jgi:ribokinase